MDFLLSLTFSLGYLCMQFLEKVGSAKLPDSLAAYLSRGEKTNTMEEIAEVVAARQKVSALLRNPLSYANNFPILQVIALRLGKKPQNWFEQLFFPSGTEPPARVKSILLVVGLLSFFFFLWR